ncbi:MAG TPA: hypothetical protein VM537_33655 [Anaerolineae bacterium]|nr:hypothetical protein [Anaerolineae bacterium]
MPFDDLLHYQKIVVALIETIRLAEEIDEDIPSWPTQSRPSGMCGAVPQGQRQHRCEPLAAQVRNVSQGLTAIHNRAMVWTLQ